MRKTGRPIDLKPKNGITFDKSKIECFNCQKLGHFARECRFAKYQENRANGRNEKRIVAIEDSNSKALVATDNNEDIDWTKEFDAEPVTFAMMALTEVEQDDWSMEFDAEHVHFGQDGLGDFDWSNKADDAPVSLALMATNSEVPYCSKCSKSYKKLLESYQTERDNFQRARTEILGYQMSLESLEVMLKTHEKNEYAWGDKYEQMEYDLKIRDLKLEEKQKELDQALKERDDFKVKLEKWSNASVLQNEVLNKQRYVSDKSCIGFGIESSNSMESDISSGDETLTDSTYENFKREKAYKAVPPPTGTIIPPRANVSFTGIDELAIRNKVVNQEKTNTSQSAIDRNKVIIEDWVDSDDEETDVSESQKETVFNTENSEESFENRSPNSHVLSTHPTLELDLDFILLSEPLFAYIVWIFLPFLTYPVAPPYLLSCGNEDTIFDPGISIYHSFMPDVSHRLELIMKFQCLSKPLEESPWQDFYLPLATPWTNELRGRSGQRLG
ncbi:ribonuclease H-like domain-containing protein [Tanacetum coccineum]